jgi:hypothetical protein
MTEKKMLLKILSKFKSTINSNLKKHNVEIKELENTQEFKILETELQLLPQRLTDVEYMKSNFDFDYVL